MALVNPDILGYQKWVQQLFRTYSSEISTLRTEWDVYQDSDGDIVAIVPKLIVDFKKGSDVLKDLMKQHDTTYAGEVIFEGDSTSL